MKAIVNTIYGSPDVLQFKDVAQPTPQDDEVLIRVHAASLNAADWHLLRADPSLVRLSEGLLKPKRTILGADVAGRVEAVGRSVTQFEPGDAVFGDLASCGFGALAEYVCARADVLVSKPAGLSFEQAAAMPMASVTALQALRDHGQLRSGQHVLINGASGGVGTFAVQLAKAFGADVTAVCSTGKIGMVRALGADHVIDYTKADFTRLGQRYDLILAANGYHSLLAYKRTLTATGRYVTTGGRMAQMFQAMLLGPLLSLTGSRSIGFHAAKPNAVDLAFVTALFEAGKVAPVIDRCYPLREVPEAMHYLEAGHARGKVVITVGHP